MVWGASPVLTALCTIVSLGSLYGFMFKGLNATTDNFEQTKKEISELLDEAHQRNHINKDLKRKYLELLDKTPSFNQLPQIMSGLGGLLASAIGITNLVRVTSSDSDSVNQQNAANLAGNTIAVLGNGLFTLTSFSSLVHRGAKLHELTQEKIRIMKEIQGVLENQLNSSDPSDNKSAPRG